MKYIFTIIVLFIQFSLFGQTALPYFTGFDNTQQKQGWQQARKGDQGFYEWVYDTNLPYSAPECLTHNYPVGGTNITDDWFISPAFDLSSGGKIDSIRHSFGGFGLPASGDTVAIYLLSGNPDPAFATNISLLYDFRDTAYTNDATWKQTKNITIAPRPGNTYIAFRYKTTANWLDVKFDNLHISSNAPTSVKDVKGTKNLYELYPNPTYGNVFIRSGKAISAVIISDLSGQIIYTADTFDSSVNLSTFNKGLYYITVRTKDGLSFTKPVLKL